MVGLLETLGFFIVILSLVAIAAIAYYFDHKKNIAMIEKGLVPEDEKRKPENTLGWGIVILGIGISLLIGERFDLGAEAIIGLIFASIGIALIVSYLFAKK